MFLSHIFFTMNISTSSSLDNEKRGYIYLNRDFVTRHFCKFYTSTKIFRHFCRDEGEDSRRAQLGKIGAVVGLLEEKKLSNPWLVVEERLQRYFQQKNLHAKTLLQNMSNGNFILTGDEKNLMVKTCQMLSNMGIGLDQDTALDVINNILQVRIEDKHFKQATRGVVRRLVAENSTLLNLLKGNALDPARVRQATEDVRNAMFVRLDNYVKILHDSGKVPWKSWDEVSCRDMSNMDEVATNCHDHRKKIIGDQTHLGRIFQVMQHGDSKMPFHITLCITSNPQGKYINYIFFYSLLIYLN